MLSNGGQDEGRRQKHIPSGTIKCLEPLDIIAGFDRLCVIES